ncbi:hypothetical protein [uncultured Oscillibacter sp.]|uniref:hypothetical protein n=1 Tax=uncultured Oscillibacter sp. TaxID=876091 RepID=UPI002619B3F8|nr:hypothetical protein [uncultured Oscillibacter sp.]
MDYLGRELERQRAALAALLLGGGEDGDAARGRERGPAGPAAARGRAAGPSGRSAGGGPEGGPGDEALGAGELVRGAGQDRWSQSAGRSGEAEDLRAEGPGAGGSGGGPERSRRGTDVPAVPAWAAQGDGAGPLGGTAAARKELSGPSGGYEARRRTRETAAAGTAGRRRAGERSAEGGPGRGGDAGSGGDGGRIEWMPMAGPARRGGGGGGTGPGGQEGLPAFPETGGAGGTVPWGGPGETAALRAEEGARALSRAVQRDARRYDGGFTIY